MPRGRKGDADPRLAVAYIRKSSDEPGHGPAAQRTAIERWAAAHSIVVASFHEDLGVSGALAADRRPGLLAALQALRDGRAGTLIIARRDRIARDITISLAIERLVAREGARICTADGAGNGTTPEAELLRGLLDLFAGFERSLIRSRTRAALEAKRTRGERTGYVAYGYRLSDDAVHLTEDEGEQAIIAEICSLSAQGVSSRRIAAQLNEWRRPARGARWHPTTILEIIRRERVPAASADGGSPPNTAVCERPDPRRSPRA